MRSAAGLKRVIHVKDASIFLFYVESKSDVNMRVIHAFHLKRMISYHKEITTKTSGEKKET